MLAAPLVAAAIRARGRDSSSIDATELLVTTDQFGAAEPLMDQTRAQTTERLRPLLTRGETPVVTGFIGATVDGVQTTLGRGGSDYSASILGAALDADEVWIWTDVDGVMTANPSEVSGAQTLPEISYSEASELAYYGAKVLHYKTILPGVPSAHSGAHSQQLQPDASGDARERRRRSVDPRRQGRDLDSRRQPDRDQRHRHARDPWHRRQGVRRRRRAAVERADDFAGVVREQHLLRDQRGGSAACAARRCDRPLEIELARGHIEEIAAQPVAVVAAIGDRMRGTPGIAATVFGALGAERINVIAISQGSSERNISLVVAESDATPAVRALHQAFRLERASASVQ